eukprot:1239001-Prymnesium_polylepis.1
MLVLIDYALRYCSARQCSVAQPQVVVDRDRAAHAAPRTAAGTATGTGASPTGTAHRRATVAQGPAHIRMPPVRVDL